MKSVAHGELEPSGASNQRLCAHCAGTIRADARPHAKYCSTQCRQKASRAAQSVTSVEDNDDAAPEATQRSSRRLEYLAAGAVMTTALALLGLSLTHLSDGVTIITKSSERDGFLMAVGIDAGFIVCEAATLVASSATRPAVERFSTPTIIGALVVSACMNAFSFARQADGWMMWPAIGLGIAIPCMTYSLTRIGAALFLEDRK